jgi:thiol-disulfide isomerase/thioredoxin
MKINLSKAQRLLGFAALGLGLSVIASVAEPTHSPEKLDGRWAASIREGDAAIPFRLDISTSGNQVVGKLYNTADDFETTTSASLENGTLQLNFEHYLTKITAHVKDGELDGQLTVTWRSPIIITPGQNAEVKPSDKINPFHATRYVAPTAAALANVPNIDGIWEIPHETSKGEKAWRLIVQQKGDAISASVLRIDGDTGALTGNWQDGKFVASHFDGSRPGLVQITPQADGSLHVVLNTPPRDVTVTAYRPEVARAKGFPEPSNFLTHSSVRDPNEVFAYSFRDVNGKLVSNDDPQFKGKVVLAIVTGTWCPNCHDEAKYLVQLYQQYHDKGVEIVALDFEESDQLASLTRVHAFISQYKVPYSYLIAGTPDEMWDKVPQAVNLNTWPATIFVGRDGRVKAIHSGFAGPATGVYNDQLKTEFTSLIDKLLKEAPVQSTAGLIKPVSDTAGR